MTEFAALAPLAEALRARHHGPEDLVLPNAWDAASAREVVDGGFPVVATTSSGVAKSLGWADGEETPLDEMFAAIARITRVVDVPVTADIEGGYGLSPEQLVARLLAAGAVGCNVEDADHGGDAVLHDANRQADYLAAMRAAARETGVSIVINARIDVFIREFGEPKDRVAETLRRAATYGRRELTASSPSGSAMKRRFVQSSRAPACRSMSGCDKASHRWPAFVSSASRASALAGASTEERLRIFGIG